MSRPDLPEVRVALIASKPKARWTEWLVAQNVRVVVEAALADVDPHSQVFAEADALLVDLGQATDDELDIFDQILESHDLPLVFADPGTWESGSQPGEKLAQKIREAVKTLETKSQVPAVGHVAPEDDYDWDFSVVFPDDIKAEDPVVERPPAVESDKGIPDVISTVPEITMQASDLTALTPEQEELAIAAEVEALGLEDDGLLVDSEPAETIYAEDQTATEPPDDRLVAADVGWGTEPTDAEIELAAFILSDASLMAANDPEIEKPEHPEKTHKTPVWILGASLGGPEAVKKFLSRLPEDTDAILILAQHIGKGFDQLLSEQLNRNCALTVTVAAQGVSLQPRHVYVVPVEGKVRIRDNEFVIEDDPEKHLYTPCIDAVMYEAAEVFGKTANAIVFTGMGADGAKGAAAIAEKGGTVWAQSEESCVMPSMPNATREEQIVSYSDSPEHLALRLTNKLGSSQVA